MASNSGGDEFIAPISDTTPANVSQQRISDSPENDNNHNTTSSNLQMSKWEENLINELVDKTIDLIDHENLTDSSSIRTTSSERDDDLEMQMWCWIFKNISTKNIS